MYIDYHSNIWGQCDCFMIIIMIKEAVNWSEVAVKTFIIL